jgi:hypothetical protein
MSKRFRQETGQRSAAIIAAKTRGHKKTGINCNKIAEIQGKENSLSEAAFEKGRLNFELFSPVPFPPWP